MRGFQPVRRAYTAACREVLRGGGSDVLSEAAFPSYAHRNPLINRLFWMRIKRVLEYVTSQAPFHTVLDFGCGGGAVVHLLSPISDRVIAADIDLSPARAIAFRLALPANVELRDLRAAPLSAIPSGSVDLVVALDVLEHVDDLEGTVRELYRVLVPGGKVIVSGPTENWLYQLGRRIAGREFTGAYHVRNVDSIGQMLRRAGRVERLGTLYPWLPLFKFFVGVRVSSGPETPTA